MLSVCQKPSLLSRYSITFNVVRLSKPSLLFRYFILNKKLNTSENSPHILYLNASHTLCLNSLIVLQVFWSKYNIDGIYDGDLDTNILYQIWRAFIPWGSLQKDGCMIYYLLIYQTLKKRWGRLSEKREKIWRSNMTSTSKRQTMHN